MGAGRKSSRLYNNLLHCASRAQRAQASKCAGRGDIPVPRLLVGADAPNPGCFAAARPGGRLSLAAGAAVLLSIVVEE